MTESRTIQARRAGPCAKGAENQTKAKTKNKKKPSYEGKTKTSTMPAQ
jgi:hypothetical protein